MNHELANKLLSREIAEAYLPTIQRLRDRTAGMAYRFQPDHEFKTMFRADPAAGMKVYWSEILYRAHLAAVTALLRSYSWLESATHALQEESVFGFSASLRGLIESAADSHDALWKVPRTLADLRPIVQRAIKGTMGDRLAGSQELEDLLIHFTHARKVEKGEEAPDSHRAKTSAEYLKSFERMGMPHVRRLYSILCEYVHPTAQSVHCFVKSSDGVVWELAPGEANSFVREIAPELPTALGPVIMAGFNSPLLVLGVLNRLPLSELHSPEFVPSRFRGIQAWVDIEQVLRAH